MRLTAKSVAWMVGAFVVGGCEGREAQFTRLKRDRAVACWEADHAAPVDRDRLNAKCGVATREFNVFMSGK